MENVRWLLGEDTFIREIGGEKRLYSYLKENARTIADGTGAFLLYDALNCENGCICGTAVDPEISGNDKVRQHLLELGLVTGAVVTVVSSENDNVILAVGESRVAVGADLARRIMV